MSLLVNDAGQQLFPSIALQARSLASAHPEISVYAGPQPPQKAVTLRTIRSKYEKKLPISMATAYDYPSAVHVSNERHQLHCVLPAGVIGISKVHSCSDPKLEYSQGTAARISPPISCHSIVTNT